MISFQAYYTSFYSSLSLAFILLFFLITLILTIIPLYTYSYTFLVTLSSLILFKYPLLVFNFLLYLFLSLLLPELLYKEALKVIISSRNRYRRVSIVYFSTIPYFLFSRDSLHINLNWSVTDSELSQSAKRANYISQSVQNISFTDDWLTDLLDTLNRMTTCTCSIRPLTSIT